MLWLRRLGIVLLVACSCSSWGSDRFWLGCNVDITLEIHQLLSGVLEDKGTVLPEDMAIAIEEAENAEVFLSGKSGNAAWVMEQFPGQKVAGKNLSSTSWAILPVVIAVNADCPLENISIGELKRIFSGRMTAWPNGVPIRLGGMPQASAVGRIFRKLVMQQDIYSKSAPEPGSDILPDLLVCRNLAGCRALLESVPGMIVFGDMQLQSDPGKKYKILKVNNVEPSAENISRGSYPLFADLLMVWRVDKKADKVSEAAEFLRRTARESGRFVAAKEKNRN